MRTKGGAYNPDVVIKYKSNLSTIQGRSGQAERVVAHEQPYMFLAYELDNPGIFDESNDNYYMNYTIKDFNGNETTHRKFKDNMVLVTTNETGDKTHKNVKVNSAYYDIRVLIVEEVEDNVLLGGTRRRRRGGRRYTRRRY